MRLVSRQRLIDRLTNAGPRVLNIIAPAGYGKSTLVRQYASTLPSSVICDAAAAQDAASFAKEVCYALAQGDAVRKDALADQSIAAAGAPERWIEFALTSWSEWGGVALVVFENFERLSDMPGTVEFFTRLLPRGDPARAIAICSRRPLPFSLTRFFAPNDIVGIGSEDLRFDPDETARAFDGISLTGIDRRRILEITRGWPMAVLLFARLARERSIEAILTQVEPMAFAELYDYLSEEVWATLPPQRQDVLLALTAIPNARSAEIAAATGGGVRAIEDLPLFAQTIPLLYESGDGRYEAHPLVADMLRHRFAQRCRSMLLDAAGGIRETDPLRAAELFLFAGDEENAASLLQDVSELWLSETPKEFIAAVSQISRGTLLRHPALWAASTAVRLTSIPHLQWLNEALVVFESLDETAPASVHLGVATSLGNVLSNFGRHDETLAVLDRFVERHPDLTLQAWALVAFYQAGMSVRSGRLSGALALWYEAKPALMDVRWTHAIGIVEVEAKVARYCGNRTDERTLLDTAVSLARDSGTEVACTMTLQEAAFAAWFAGEDALFQRYARELEECSVPTTARGTEVFRSCARGEFDLLLRRLDFEHPKIRFYAALIACAASSDRREQISGIALDAARDAGEPALITLAWIARAESVPDERPAAAANAQKTLSAMDSDVFSNAVAQYASGSSHPGMLAAFVERFRTAASSDAGTTGPLVCIRNACVLKDNRDAGLSERELELILFLAARRRAYTREEIIDALWPDRTAGDSTVLRVYVNRVRTKLGDRKAITLDGTLYKLGSHISVDLDEIERALVSARNAWPMTETARARLSTCFERFGIEQSPLTNQWPWFNAVAVRMDAAVREAATLLARDAADRRDFPRAADLCNRILESDPCDEPAREVLIRSHLSAGNRQAALREFRAYRDAMARDLGAQPSAGLVGLISSIDESRSA